MKTKEEDEDEEEEEEEEEGSTSTYLLILYSLTGSSSLPHMPSSSHVPSSSHLPSWCRSSFGCYSSLWHRGVPCTRRRLDSSAVGATRRDLHSAAFHTGSLKFPCAPRFNN